MEVTVVNRNNYLLVKQHLSFLDQVRQISQASLDRYWFYLKHLLIWADETLFMNSQRINPSFPKYVASLNGRRGEPNLSNTSQKKIINTAKRFLIWAKETYNFDVDDIADDISLDETQSTLWNEIEDRINRNAGGVAHYIIDQAPLGERVILLKKLANRTDLYLDSNIETLLDQKFETYLDDLQERWEKERDPDREVKDKINEILSTPNLKQKLQKRRQRMLEDKIDVTAFLIWFVENYPDSSIIMKENPEETQKQFMTQKTE